MSAAGALNLLIYVIIIVIVIVVLLVVLRFFLGVLYIAPIGSMDLPLFTSPILIFI